MERPAKIRERKRRDEDFIQSQIADKQYAIEEEEREEDRRQASAIYWEHLRARTEKNKLLDLGF